MLYDYYCMNCGKKINQDSVLFDMQYLISRNKTTKFSILNFRMTQAELKTVIDSGQANDAGFRKCKLSFADVMKVIANEHNLNDPQIARLEREELEKYILAQQVSEAPKDSWDAAADMWDAEPEVETVPEEAVPEKPYEPSEAMLTLEEKDTTNTDKAVTKILLSNDLSLLQMFFANGDTVELDIRKIHEQDNDGHDVLVGLDVKYSGGNVVTFQNRVCSRCGDPVFAHAGTAKHQAIAFIGYQSSGKTSTILSLTSYVENHLMQDFGSKIWEGNSSIPTVATIEVLGKGGQLQEDLSNYSRGVAPRKNEANQRKDAYSVTFRLKNTTRANHYYLLTLTDLPGELCNSDGTIDKDKVNNQFPVALSCDAFIACFDTINVDPDNTGVTGWVQNVCRWTDEFQKMRATQNGVETYVPTMLLFTKCVDLEEGRGLPPLDHVLLPVDRTYSLQEEKRHIDLNNIYSFVRKQFNEFGQLHKAYHAMMRGSPYGYAAPSTRDLNLNPNIPYHQPTPKNMDKLMRWVLSVSGCIPTEAEYRITPSSNNVLKLNNFCISRPQLRNQPPMGGQEVQEALARCSLFENPGKFDRSFVGCYDDNARLFLQKLQVKVDPNGNLKEAK